MEFKLKDDVYISSISINRNDNDSLNNFDRTISEKWKAAVDAGLCRYRLGNLQTKILPGKYNLIAQLNPERARQRRTPQDLQCVQAKFNPDEFNFNKANQEETLMTFGKSAQGDDHVAIINVSPLEFGHCLLVPSIQANIPQQVTHEGLVLLLKILLCSGSLLNDLMTLHELKQVEHITGPCYALKDFPSKGFAFQLESNVDELARHVFSILSYFRVNDIAHNFFVTRGTRFGTATSDVYDTIRVIVWAREPTFGVKEEVGFNPALCELAGHLLIKEPETFDVVTEEKVNDLLNSITEPWFQQVYEKVREVFSS